MVEVAEIALATPADVAGILALQERNLPESGGKLSVRFSGEWFATALAAMPVIVARRNGTVVGYLVSSSIEANAEVSVVKDMLKTYSGSPGAYVYGPICVAETERGRGLAAQMFAVLKSELPGREGILFIRSDNGGSLSAHRRMGMREPAEFEHGGVAFVVLSYLS